MQLDLFALVWVLKESVIEDLNNAFRCVFADAIS